MKFNSIEARMFTETGINRDRKLFSRCEAIRRVFLFVYFPVILIDKSQNLQSETDLSANSIQSFLINKFGCR